MRQITPLRGGDDDLTDLEKGLLVILARAASHATAVCDVQREAGNVAIGESVLARYLLEGVAWSAAMIRHREHWAAVAREAQARWFVPDPEEEAETELRAWLQGE